MRQLEAPRLARHRAGKRALLVAEQLGFEQRVGNRRAVDRDKRPVGARAERVQAAREQLLAGAALAFEQHRRVGGRGAVQLLQHLAERRVLADDPRRAAPLGQLLLQQDVLGQHAPLRDGALHHQQQVIGIDRLGEKVRRPLVHRGHGVLNAAVRGHDDHRQLGVELLGRAQDAKPVAGRQLEIGEDHGRARLAKLLNGFRLVARFEDDVALRLERMAQHGAQRILVFDKEDGKRGYRGHQTCFMSLDCPSSTESHATMSAEPRRSSRRATTSILRRTE